MPFRPSYYHLLSIISPLTIEISCTPNYCVKSDEVDAADAASPVSDEKPVATINTAQRMDGTWNFIFPPVSFQLKMANGRLSIEGQRIRPVPYQNGYVTFRFGFPRSLDFYVNFQSKPKILAQAWDPIYQDWIPGKAIEVKEEDKIPSDIMQRIKALSGQYGVSFENSNIHRFLYFSGGRVWVHNQVLWQEVKLYRSDDPRFPQSIGWVKWSYGIPDAPDGYLKVLSAKNIQFAVTLFNQLYVGPAYIIHLGQEAKDENPDSMIESILADATSLETSSAPREEDEHPASIVESVQADAMTPLRSADDGIPAAIMNKVAKLSETWTFNFLPMPPFDIKFDGGKLSLAGHPRSLERSDKPSMSTSDGWVKFSVSTLDFYLRFNAKNVQYAAFDEDGKQKHGKISKEGAKDGDFSPVPPKKEPDNSINTGQRMNGAWDFTFHVVIFRLTMTNGKLSIYGQRIYPVPSQNGYVKFHWLGLDFYVNFQSKPKITVMAYHPLLKIDVPGTVTEVVIPFHILQRISALYGYYGGHFALAQPFSLYFYGGQVEFNNYPVVLSRSSDRQFPERIGWVKWSYGASYGYLKVLGVNDVQFAMIYFNQPYVGRAYKLYQAPPMRGVLPNPVPADVVSDADEESSNMVNL